MVFGMTTALVLGSTVGAQAFSPVSPGDSGPDVHRLQTTLEQWRPGILGGAVGGPQTARYGPRTLRAVQEAAGPLRGHHNPSNTYRVGPLFMSSLDAAVGNGASTSVTTVSRTPSRASVAVSAARSRIGAPYAFGGTGPRFDCSGLVQASWREAGVNLPRTSSAQFAHGTRVSSPQPGDIAGFDFSGNGRIDHVGLYIGDGRMIDASSSLQRVVQRPVIQRGLVGYARP
jgi:cell wall-associated NlpC family hydrolase